MNAGPRKVLLVEDNPGDARLIREMLTEAGEGTYDIEWVPRLSEALERLARDEIDVVLLDLGLPDSYGLDTFLRAHAQAPQVPFVVLTGLSDETLAVTAVRKGAQDYLVKGETDGNLLLRAIRYAGERKQAELALRQAHDSLEQRVQERTLELVQANVQLQGEIERRKNIEAALQESEARYRAIFENTGTATCIVEADRTISLANMEFERLSGYSREEIEGQKHAGEFVASEDLEGLREYLRVRQNDPSLAPRTHEFRLKDREGRVKDILLTASTIPGTRRTVTALMDITSRKEAEKTLRHQAELLELARDAIMVRDMEDRLIFWNQGAELTYGYPREAALGQVPHTFLKTEFPRPMPEIQAEFLREGKWEGELVHSRADGLRLIVASRWVLQRDEHGHPAAVLEINRDITARKQAEQALRLAHDNLELKVLMRTAELARANEELQQEIDERRRAEKALETERQRLFALLDGLPAMVYLKALDGSIRFANRTFRERFGEPGGRRCYEVIHGRDKLCESCRSFEVLGTGKSHSWELSVAASGLTFQVYDYPFADVDGTPQVLTLGIDVTERKQTEEALRAAQERLQFLFRSTPAVIYSSKTDGDFDTTFVSDNVSAQLGYEPREILGGSGFWLKHIHPEDVPGILAAVPRIFEQGKYVFEYRFAHKDGSYRWLRDEVRLVRDAAGNPAEMVGSIIDITERQEAEEKLRESETNLRYLATQLMTAQERERKRLSRELHDELGQSLLVLKLQMGAMEEKMAQGWEAVQGDCGSMMAYLNQVVEDVRRLSRDLSPTILEDLGLSAALRRLLGEFSKYYVGEVNMDEMDEIDDLFPPEAQINLYRIFQESLTNIGKYAQASRVTFSIKRLADHVAFRMEDNGRGFNLAQVSSADAAGRGLGLAAMEERVRMLGGVLNIQSQEGQGTKISFEAPNTREQKKIIVPEGGLPPSG
jgi:PAS domain S-box-containing protein